MREEKTEVERRKDEEIDIQMNRETGRRGRESSVRENSGRLHCNSVGIDSEIEVIL